MPKPNKTQLYLCNGDSLGKRSNIRPSDYEVDGDTMLKIREALFPHYREWLEAAPYNDLHKLLASVYLQGVLDGGQLEKCNLETNS